MQNEAEEAQGEAIQTGTEEVEQATEQSKVSLHIYMPTDEYERVKKFARYAAIEGMIEGHPRGNVSDYCNFCFNLGETYLRQYMLNKRGFK